MKWIGTFFKMLSPFNNMDEMPPALYTMKKLLAFLLIYVAAGILQQIVLTVIFVAIGFDPVQGLMPPESTQMIAMYYGFVVYLILAYLYCRYIEKQSLKTIGFNGHVFEHMIGAGIALVLLAVIMGIGCMSGGFVFDGMDKDYDYVGAAALLGGLMIQGAAEEAMCRGFLMTSLQKRISTPAAIFWSTTVFVLPHLSNLFVFKIQYALIGIINLYLISVIFSLLFLYRKNIWIACGLHSIWNFFVYGVLGLTLSGYETGATGLFIFKTNGFSILNGGSYGIEASIITTVVCAVLLIVLFVIGNKQRGK